jgi:hypothetical protein
VSGPKVPSDCLQSTVAQRGEIVSTTDTSVSRVLATRGIVQPVAERVMLPIVCPVDMSAILVPRTPAMISRVPTLYDPVSVSIRHQRDQFSRRAEAIVVPSARYPRSSDTTVSPSRRRSERSGNMIVRVHPTGVLSISPAFSMSPVAVDPERLPSLWYMVELVQS